MSKRSASRQSVEKMEEIARLLVRIPAICGACELDLLVFFHRHPRALLTNEQLAAFVGYDMKQVARTVDAFVDAGLLERNKNPTHAARLYVLLPDGQQGGGLTTLLKVASTRQGRLDILKSPQCEAVAYGSGECSRKSKAARNRLTLGQGGLPCPHPT